MNATRINKVCATIFILLSMFSAHAEGLTLVRSGTAKVKIIIPAKTELDHYLDMSDADAKAFLLDRFPNSTDEEVKTLLGKYKEYRFKEAKRVGDEEKLALAELQEYIRRISGAGLNVVFLKDGEKLPAYPAIVLGTALARQAGLESDLDQLGPDGIMLKVTGNKLFLSGSCARGTLYAVYDLLESFGCRWLMPGTAGEIIPQKKTLVTSVDKTENPSFKTRNWWCTYRESEEYAQWTLRNKGDYRSALGSRSASTGNFSHALGDPLEWGAAQTPLGIKTRDENNRDIDRLPDEYYAMKDGKPLYHIPNMSNPKVWDLYAECFVDYFKNQYPFSDYVSVSAEDGFVFDDRASTQALDSYEYDPYMGAMSATDRLWFFFDKVIERVNKVVPNRRFAAYVYSNNTAPPRIVRINPSMALSFAPLSISPQFSIYSKKSRSVCAFKNWFESWMLQAKAVGAETYFHDYEPMGYQWNQAMICPRWKIIAENYKYFREKGLDGHLTQGFDEWASSGLDNWMMIRLFWNVNQDYNDILNDYCEKRFAEAAPAVREYYEILEKRMDEIPELYGNEIYGNHLILTPDVRKQCRMALEKAKSLVKDPFAQKQLDLLIEVQRSTDAFCDGIEIARETGDFSAANQKIRVSFEIKDALNKIYPNFMHPSTLDTTRTSPSIYEPAGWYQKYSRWNRKIKDASASVVLPRYWKVMQDNDQQAVNLGLHQPEQPVDTLDNWDVTIMPDLKYQNQHEPSAVFLRTSAEVPGTFAGKKMTIFFPTLLARAMHIWINGKPVEFSHGDYTDHIYRGNLYFWDNYDYQEEFDVTKLIEPGKNNVIAVRIYKSLFHAGMLDRVFLLGN